MKYCNYILLLVLLFSSSLYAQESKDSNTVNQKLILEGDPDEELRLAIEKEIEDKKKLGPKKLKKIAVLAAKKGDIYNAIDFYELYVSKKEQDYKALYVLANLYQQTRNYQAAYEAFNELYATDSNAFLLAQYYLALNLKQRGEYQTAEGHFKRFRKKYKGHRNDKLWRKKAKLEMESCLFALKPVLEQDIDIHPLDTFINQRYSDFSPVFLNDSNIIYSSLKPEGFLIIGDHLSVQVLKFTNVYEAKWIDSSWKNVGVFAPLDKKEWLGKLEPANGVFSQDGLTYYFSLCERTNKGIRCDLCYTKRTANSGWSDIIKLEEHINHPKFTNTQPCIGIESKKGREVLYFTSNRLEGSRGGYDIWYTIKHPKTGKFGKVKNAGKGINTVGDEMTPYMDHSTKSLYFGSNMWPGYGGFDIFKTTGELRKWGVVENIGKPYNSNSDDLYYAQSSDKEKGFVVSNRPGSIALKHDGCCDDIFSFKKLHILRLGVGGKVEGEDGLKLKGVTVALYLVDKTTKEDLLLKYVELDDAGSYFFDVDPGIDYKVVVVKDKYLNNAVSFKTDTFTVSDTFGIQSIVMQKPSKPIRLDDIHYESGSYELPQSVKDGIDSTLFMLIQANPKIIVEISSHTDDVGTAQSNMKLSKQRASEIIHYLVGLGIDKKRLRSKGYGETLPIASNETVEGRSKNRRTEFRVVGKVKERTSKRRKDDDD